MSDFFSDDFTAELKSYFLNSVISGTENFIDLVDAKIWKRIRNESAEQSLAWSVDAKTNEFHFLATWLEEFDARTKDLAEPADLIKALQALKEYASALLIEKTDSMDLARKFSEVAQNSHEVIFLHCKSGPQEFAVPLLNVIEISAHLPIFGMPEKKFGILGVVPFRGDALPVINLQDHGFKPVGTENVFYLVCEQSGNRFCLQVTGTEDLLNLKESDLQEVQETNILPANHLITKFFIHELRSIMILDLEKLVA
ncbi:chemotaxis protein [Bdellovibrio bacteriovorus]|uniref:Chemotaxis protein n=1 Tax=Bdellovibrio bacteriovorus TaxID=959 RepID=A0A150WS50_BDEBC|nr:chemotaxis protein CheW [Bdellovibrio bacteriovorus]KYG67198.1 chemotaxis protein [Bdellovibrio bacteriovorus]